MKGKAGWIVAISAFCVGIALITVGVFMGGSTQAYINLGFFTGNLQENETLISFEGRSRVASYEEIELDEVKVIFCGANLADINIIKSDRAYISHNISNLDFEITDGNIINLFEKNNNDFTFNIGIFTGFINEKPEINIYVTDELEFISVKSDVGNTNIEGVTVKKIEINNNLGVIKLDSVKTEVANINLDMGNLEMNNFEVSEEGKFSNNMGNIDLELVGAFGDFTIIDNVSLGESNIDTSGVEETEKEKAVIHATTEVGNINIKFTQ